MEFGLEKKKEEREREGERERRKKRSPPLSQGCFLLCSSISFSSPSTTSDSPLRFFLSRDVTLLLEFVLRVFP